MTSPESVESLLASAWFEVYRRGNVVHVVRTDRAFRSAREIDRAHGDVARVLEPLPRAELGILVDLRMAPARNDPEFEKAVAEHRRRIPAGFARRAVVVQTEVGKLHVQRHARQDGDPGLAIFTDPLLALELVRGT